MEKKNNHLDLLSNPKKKKTLLESNIHKQISNNAFSIAKEELLYKINNIKETDLSKSPINEVDTTIHVLFQYLLYKDHIKTIYGNIKQKLE